MNSSVRDRALAYLESHHVLNLATTGPEGIWTAAVFYANDGFTLYFLSGPTSRHGRNLADNASVAGTVQEDYGDWPEIKGIQLEGRVTRVRGEEEVNVRQHYGQKFPMVADSEKAPPAIAEALSRIAWYKLEPRKLFFIDNALGFGHRDDVPLS